MAVGQKKQAQEKINKQQFENMCWIQCTQFEICSILDISEDTLTRWCKATYGMDFAGSFKKFSSGGKMSLRRNMFKQAEKNPTMAIWLSKQHLGMRDNVEVEHNVNNGVLDNLLGAMKDEKARRNAESQAD